MQVKPLVAIRKFDLFLNLSELLSKKVGYKVASKTQLT